MSAGTTKILLIINGIITKGVLPANAQEAGINGADATTGLYVILLAIIGTSILAPILYSIYRDLKCRKTSPDTFNELEKSVENTLDKYGRKHFGKANFRILKCPELHQWIIMRAAPEKIFLQRRSVSSSGIKRHKRRSQGPLPSREHIQNLFESEALLVMLNTRRTHYEVHGGRIQQRPVCSNSLSSKSLYHALCTAKEQAPFKLGALPPGHWHTCKVRRLRH